MYQSNETNHCQTRKQNRGISMEVIDLVEMFGEKIRGKNKASVKRIPRSSLPEIEEMLGRKAFAKIERKLRTYLIKQGSKVVTAGFALQRFHR